MDEVLSDKGFLGSKKVKQNCNQDEKLHSKLQPYEMDLEYLVRLNTHREHNKPIIQYYGKMARESIGDKFAKKKDAVEQCNSWHFFETFENIGVRSWDSTNLCRDKFCANCKKIKSIDRRRKFQPEIDKAKDDGRHLYHLVLTIPNVVADELPETLAEMHRKVAKLIEFIKGKRKIKDLSFGHWGYDGAIRSTEITYKSRSDWYHPHVHMLISTTRPFLSEKKYKNAFSVDRKKKRPTRLFSEEEVLIQRLWYLIWNVEHGERITRDKILAVEQGYSCMVDEFKEEDFHELFKYMTKTNEGTMTYKNFVTLYDSLYFKRQIQGYGRFFALSESLEDELEIDEKFFEEIYNELYQQLVDANEKSPEKGRATLRDLMKDDFKLVNLKRHSRELLELLKNDSLD